MIAYPGFDECEEPEHTEEAFTFFGIHSRDASRRSQAKTEQMWNAEARKRRDAIKNAWTDKERRERLGQIAETAWEMAARYPRSKPLKLPTTNDSFLYENEIRLADQEYWQHQIQHAEMRGE